MAARVIVLAVACALTPACAARPGDTGFRLGMVTDVGGLGDRSFNDGANHGLDEAKAKLGARAEVLQSRSASDYQPNLTLLADKAFDEIYGVGFLMSKDLAEVANRYPGRHFAIIDAVVDLPNVASVTFREEDGSFLAGALAAMVSKSKTIGFIGGVDIPLIRKFEAGYAAGAREIDPSVKVLVKYVGSFNDVPSGKEVAHVLFGQGADIVYAAAGKAGLGAFSEVKSHPGDYVIGVDADQDGIVPGRVLTSMVKRVDLAVLRIATDAKNEKPDAGHIVLGLADDAVGLTPFTYTKAVVTARMRAKLDALKAAVVAGSIHVPATREELAHFVPVPIP